MLCLGSVAEQISTAARRALKVMRPETVRDETLRAMFAQEARAGAAIQSRHVVQVVAAGVDEASGMPWLAMELLDGEDLGARVARVGALPQDEAWVVLDQLCHALGAAHRAREPVVHRDLKPENVFLARAHMAGSALLVKLLDLGIAKVLAQGGSSAATLAIGTPLWMAPEQSEPGLAITPRTDVWALGLVAFYMLTGRSYWRATNAVALLREILFAPLPPASERGGVPPGFDAWFARSVARDPAQRWPDAVHARDALAELLPTTTMAAFSATQPALPRAATPNNLPAPMTSFVGRAHDVEQIEALLGGDATRLVTLTGSGGAGKTRLAVEAARRMLPRFADGVWLAELAAVTDPELVAKTVSDAMELREQPDRTPTSVLAGHLQARRALLVLDNCEHLLDACARLADTLLGKCEGLCILAASREPLGIPGETAWRVPSLAEREATELFAARAAAALPSFEVTPENAPLIAKVCRRLDGIPLAIELAAARVRALPLEKMIGRLDDRFRLLTGGSRTALPRQQTLRALIDWSHELLSPAERVVLRRTSAFEGGFTLEAAEGVCSGDDVPPEEIFDLLSSLVNKSLLSVENAAGEVRYQALETIRQYAREKLLDAEEAEGVRDRHRAFYAAVVRDATPRIQGAEQVKWLGRLSADHENVRAALEWCGDDSVERLEMATALCYFWQSVGRLREGRQWMERSIAAAERGSSLHARALFGTGTLAWMQRDDAVALRLLEQSVAVSRALDDRATLTRALTILGHAYAFAGDYAAARAPAEEALALCRDDGDRYGAARALGTLGDLALSVDDPARAEACFREGAELFESVGNAEGIAFLRLGVARVAWKTGDGERARALFADCTQRLLALNHSIGVTVLLLQWIHVAAAAGHAARAVRLAAARDAISAAYGAVGLPALERPLVEDDLARARVAGGRGVRRRLGRGAEAGSRRRRRRGPAGSLTGVSERRGIPRRMPAATRAGMTPPIIEILPAERVVTR